jgi:hypothetical protein
MSYAGHTGLDIRRFIDDAAGHDQTGGAPVEAPEFRVPGWESVPIRLVKHGSGQSISTPREGALPLRPPSRHPSALPRGLTAPSAARDLPPLPQTVVAVLLPGRDTPLGATGEASPLTARGKPHAGLPALPMPAADLFNGWTISCSAAGPAPGHRRRRAAASHPGLVPARRAAAACPAWGRPAACPRSRRGSCSRPRPP